MVLESQFGAFQGLVFAIPIFCVATMVAIGLETTLDDAVAPLRNLLGLAVVILVNCVFVPLVGFIVIVLPTLFAGGPLDAFAKLIVPLQDGQTAGFLLLILASGSMLGPAFAKLSGGTESFARGTTIALIIASTLLVPIELELFNKFGIVEVPGLEESGPIFRLLLLYQVLPLAIGIIVKARYDPVAVQLRSLFGQLAGLALLILFALLLLSGNVVSAVATPPTVTTDVATVPDVVAVEPNEVQTELLITDAGTTPEEGPTPLKELPEAREVKYPDNTKVVVLNGDAAGSAGATAWAIVNSESTYLVKYDAGAGELTAENDAFDGGTAILITDDTISGQEEKKLDDLVITQTLRDAFADSAPSASAEVKGVTLLANLVVPVGSNGDQWLLVNDAETYLVALDGSDLEITRPVSEPLGVVSEVLKSLEQLPVIGGVVEMLMQLVTIVLPYAMLAAVAAIIMIIGYYGGIAVRNTVGATGSAIPHTMASSTAVRNISFALILATEYALSDSANGPKAIGMVLVFYLMSLIVTAHKSVQWGREGETKDAKLEDLAGELAKDLSALGAGGS